MPGVRSGKLDELGKAERYKPAVGSVEVANGHL